MIHWKLYVDLSLLNLASCAFVSDKYTLDDLHIYFTLDSVSTVYLQYFVFL